METIKEAFAPLMGLREKVDNAIIPQDIYDEEFLNNWFFEILDCATNDLQVVMNEQQIIRLLNQLKERKMTPHQISIADIYLKHIRLDFRKPKVLVVNDFFPIIKEANEYKLLDEHYVTKQRANEITRIWRHEKELWKAELYADAKLIGERAAGELMPDMQETIRELSKQLVEQTVIAGNLNENLRKILNEKDKYENRNRVITRLNNQYAQDIINLENEIEELKKVIKELTKKPAQPEQTVEEFLGNYDFNDVKETGDMPF